jgi:hypothetical protein
MSSWSLMYCVKWLIELLSIAYIDLFSSCSRSFSRWRMDSLQSFSFSGGCRIVLIIGFGGALEAEMGGFGCFW